MSRSIVERLRDMQHEISFVVQATTGKTKELFLGDETLKRAVARSLEVVGEAAKHVPADFRAQHPEVPWRAIAGMRNRLIHDYGNIDYELIWDVVETKLESLQTELRRILED